jgi:O-antigen/teichoic acid export membrane protein
MIYGVGVAVSRMAGFIMLPIYTRYLRPADYGVLELLSMTVDVIGLLTTMGLAATIFKFYAQVESARDKDEIVGSAWIMLAGVAAFVLVGGLLASPWLTELVFEPDVPARYFRLFFAIFLFQRLEMVPFLLLRARHMAVMFVILSIGRLLLQLSLSIYFVVIAQRGVEGVLLATLCTSAVSGSGLSIWLIRTVRLSFSRAKALAMLRFGYPLAVYALGNFAMIFSDRYFLNAFAGISDVGIYSLGYRFVGLLSAFAFTPFNQVWQPLRFELAAKPEAADVFPKIFTYMNVAGFSLAILISVFVMDVIRVMADPAFLLAYEPVSILLFATIMFNLVAFTSTGIMHTNRTWIMSYLAAWSVFCVIGLNLLLIPRFGYMGAAWASAGAYLLRYLAMHFFSQRAYPIRYEWARVFRLAYVFVAASLLRVCVGFAPMVAALVADVAIAGSALLAIWLAVLDADERRLFTATIRTPVIRWLGVLRGTA